MKHLLILLALLIPTGLMGQAMNRTDQIDYPLNEILASPCGGESIAISGMVHGIVHTTIAAKWNSASTEINVGPRGDMQAIGLDSGTRYNLTGSTNERVSWNSVLLEGFSMRSTFNMASLFKVHYTYHLTILVDDWETPKLLVDHLKVECPGAN